MCLRIGPEAKAAVPVLAELLRDKNWLVQSNAAETLGRIGPDAKIAVPVLSELLKDTNGQVRKVAADALKQIKKEKR